MILKFIFNNKYTIVAKKSFLETKIMHIVYPIRQNQNIKMQDGKIKIVWALNPVDFGFRPGSGGALL